MADRDRGRITRELRDGQFAINRLGLQVERLQVGKPRADDRDETAHQHISLAKRRVRASEGIEEPGEVAGDVEEDDDRQVDDQRKSRRERHPDRRQRADLQPYLGQADRQAGDVHQAVAGQLLEFAIVERVAGDHVIPRDAKPRRDRQHATQEHDRQQARENDADIFPDQHFPSLDRFAHQREHGPILDLVEDRLARREEGGDEDEQEDHVKADRHEHDGVFAKREKREHPEDGDDRRPQADQQAVDRLHDRFSEGMADDHERSVHGTSE